ncbi:unnamed protein product [Mytilus coruscus]|uniref:Uncharacterized protein n=1 Tax=Mytilus coruscus TaxID=42192 RepID=A0A6J8DCB8_MYTCO|nr:unnamed protein product [Mytilus coruscus]
MEGPWNYQPCRHGHPLPMRKADTCLDFLCKYCGLEDNELSTFTCSTQGESKQQLNKLKASNRNFLKEIAVLKCENSRLDTVIRDNVILRNSLNQLNLEYLQHGRIIQKIEKELAEQTCRTDRLQHGRIIQKIGKELAEQTCRTGNFKREIVRLKEENLNLTNTKYRLTMDLKNAEMQDCHFIKLKVENSSCKHENQNLLCELLIVENQRVLPNYAHNSQQRQRRGGYPRR